MAQDDIKVIISADGSSYLQTLKASAQSTTQWARVMDGQAKGAAHSYAASLATIENRTETLNTKMRTMGHLGAGLLAGSVLTNGASNVLQSLNRRIETIEDLRGQYQFLLQSQVAAAKEEEYLLSLSDRHNKSVSVLAETYGGLLVLRKQGLLTERQAVQMQEGMSNVQSALRASNQQLGQSMYGLSQALSSPIVRMEEFNQVVEPLPGLIASLDKASGQGAGGFRRLVNDGRVTSDYFSQVLIKAFEDYEGAAASMADNLSGSWRTVGRDYDLLIRRFDQPLGAGFKASAQGLSWVLQGLAENAEAVADVAGGVLVGALTASGVQMSRNVIAARTLWLEKRQLIASNIAEAQAEVARTAAAVSSANAQVAALKRKQGALLVSTSMTKRLAAAEAQAAAATAAHTAAVNRSTSAQAALVGVGGRVLSLLTGPVGIGLAAASAGYALFSMSEQTNKSADSLDTLNERLDSALGKFDAIEARQLEGLLSEAETRYQAIENQMNILAARGQSQSAAAGAVRSEYQALEREQMALDDSITELQIKLRNLRKDKDSSDLPATVPPPAVDNTAQLRAQANLRIALAESETERIQAVYSQRHQMILKNTQAGSDLRLQLIRQNTSKYLQEYDQAQQRDKRKRTRHGLEIQQLELGMTQEGTRKAELELRRRNLRILQITREGSADRKRLLALSHEQYKLDLKAQQNEISAQHKAWQQSLNDFTAPWAGAAASMGQIFGNISEVMKEGNEQSFEESKKWATAQAIINGALAATRALAEAGPYLGPPLAASIGALTAVQIKKINEQEYSAAHGGLSYVPDESTYLLQKGERVLSPRQNEDLAQFMKDGQGAGGGLNVYLTAEFITPDARGAYQLFMDNSAVLTDAVMREFRRRNINVGRAA